MGLGRKSFSNGRSDCELGAKLYADTLSGALRSVQSLSFQGVGWGDDEVEKLAQVLQFTEDCVEILLGDSPGIGQRGLDALASALRGGEQVPKLKRIFYDQPNVKAAAELKAVCIARGVRFGTLEVGVEV